MTTYLTPDQLLQALTLRDLSDPDRGPHALQLLLDELLTAITGRLGCSLRLIRNPPVVSVGDNYDRLGYRPDDVTRQQRYTRYVSPTAMLRSHTSAELPAALEAYAGAEGTVDELIAVPGLVYRRDVVDRHHVGEPHQLDLWRLWSHPDADDARLEELIAVVVQAVLPGATWRTTPVEHPYTRAGRQVEVRHQGQWLELAECGLIHPDVLAGSGLDPSDWSGLALGMGLDRALMLRKGIPDIRYLRSSQPRIKEQLLDLEPWREVSLLPPIRRDLSVVIDADRSDELLGDQVRLALADRLDDIESVEVLSRTSYAELPPAARERLGLAEGQVNALVRVTLRPLGWTMTDQEANELRNRVYLAIHQGPHQELA